jgi:hypothetical protein
MTAFPFNPASMTLARSWRIEQKGPVMKKAAVAALFAALLSGCAPSVSNLDDVKEHAAEVWKQAGFSIIGYEGFEYGTTWCCSSEKGGAAVWYTLRRIPDNGIIYHGYIQRWKSEYHIYNIKALDAIKPR